MEGEKLEKPIDEEAIINEIKGKKFFLDSQSEDTIAIQNSLHGIAKNLKKNYPDFGKYYLFHIITSSSYGREECLYFDFPGDDSIAKQIDDLYHEYKQD